MKRPPFTLFPVLALLLSILCAQHLAAQDYRVWKDTSGRSLEAAMTGVDVAAAAVKMVRKDGTEVSVPIAILSPEDVTYAKAKWQEMQSAPAPAAAPGAMPPATPVPGAESAPPEPVTPGAVAAPEGPAAPPRPQITVIPVAKLKPPGANDYLKVSRTRPRLVHAKAGWDYLGNLAKTDATAGILLGRVKESAEKLIDTPVLSRIYGEQPSRSHTGAKALYRIAQLGALHQLDPDPRWQQRGLKEVIELCEASGFSDWFAGQHAVTTDLLIAVSLGYDWLHEGMTRPQAEMVRAAIVERGLTPLTALLDKKELEDAPPDLQNFSAAAAIIIGSLAVADEESGAAKKAVAVAAKIFGNGMRRFAPAGVWPNGPDEGDRVLDYAVLVLQSLRSATGSDLGFSQYEGFVQAGDARMHLTNPTGRIFNFGDSETELLTAPWVATWLSGVHGNPGLPALTVGAAQGPDSAFLGLTGHLLYLNPSALGYAIPAALDAQMPGPEVAVFRSAAGDPNALYAGIKGGDNNILHSQLDLGTFILDGAGQRWAVELGMETERAPGMTRPTDRARRYENYIQGTAGQNVLLSASGNQPLTARASLAGFLSTPERGMAVIDLKEAFDKESNDWRRGLMMARSPQPFVLLQDEFTAKGTQSFTWTMHTKAEITLDGSRAQLTQGKQTLTAVILSPPGAQFESGEPPDQQTPLRSLRGYRILKVPFTDVQGEQRLVIAFALGTEAVESPIVPLANWIPAPRR